ncbi:hypothetical protein, partial [Nesterenkonia salmonea]|uniref:hypothetical protein n=1 Tax=Nesterenkonia salmonea TaxID=1804987 RepID=UPI001AA04ECA
PWLTNESLEEQQGQLHHYTGLDLTIENPATATHSRAELRRASMSTAATSWVPPTIAMRMMPGQRNESKGLL